MPHVDIKYRPEIVDGDVLFAVSEEITQIVGRIYEENPKFVSIEVHPQSKWVLHRKGVDITITSSPDAEGVRERVAKHLAAELADWIRQYLNEKGVNCDISVWTTIFGYAVYEYRK